ncbi:MAG: hypothetical protein QNL67_05470 [Cryomorphaceae bacterium]|jgi:hypothetical protein
MILNKHRIFLSLLVCFIGLTLLLPSCKPNNLVTDHGVSLAFSADTVYLDTVFSTLGSSTRTVRIINPTQENILLDRIALGKGDQSPFRFNIDGVPGPEVTDVFLPAGDSLWIFVEITAPSGGVEMLHVDSLVIQNKEVVQSIDLVSLAWDAHFHYPTKVLVIPQPPPYTDIQIPYSVLPPMSTWTDDKPHVVYGYAVVDSGGTLDILAGARVHFHAQSGIWVATGGTLRLDDANQGSFDDPIVLEGDRLEPFYDDIAGQWGGLLGGIFVQRGASMYMNHTHMKNGTMGIRCDSVPEGQPANVVLQNSLLRDFSRATIYSGFGHITMQNVVVANAGLYGLYALGGRVHADHCTFYNQFPAARSTPTVGLYNRYDDGMGQFRYRDLNEAYFGNCIIAGNQDSELGLGLGSQAQANYFIEGSLLKLDITPTPPVYDVSDPNHFFACLFNANPQFVLPTSRNYQLDSASAAQGIGLAGPLSRVPLDALGQARPSLPDAGALERL